ncbi:MAG: hypothetical protein JXL82_05005 [Candidatus Omnitrophica bacterium]|nr:hypothetical protein [Candidatus Omnitrophota bacterium]
MANIYSDKTKQKARDLRHNGWSLGEIAQELKLPRNTLSGWTKEIELTKKQKE